MASIAGAVTAHSVQPSARRMERRLEAELPARARPVHHDEARARKVVRREAQDEARGDVHAAARRVRDDDLDRALAGPSGLGPRRGTRHRSRRSHQQRSGPHATAGVHGESSLASFRPGWTANRARHKPPSAHPSRRSVAPPRTLAGAIGADGSARRCISPTSMAPGGLIHAPAGTGGSDQATSSWPGPSARRGALLPASCPHVSERPLRPRRATRNS